MHATNCTYGRNIFDACMLTRYGIYLSVNVCSYVRYTCNLRILAANEYVKSAERKPGYSQVFGLKVQAGTRLNEYLV